MRAPAGLSGSLVIDHDEPERPDPSRGRAPGGAPDGGVPRRALFSWLGRRRELSPGERHTALDQLFFEGADFVPNLYRFATLMTLSVAIATFGLLADSVAVVIGAMLIAPMMTPILAFSAASVMVWPRRQLMAALVTVLAIVGSVALAALIGLATSRREPTLSEQILQRTEPTMLDLGVALAAGAAGAYVTIRTRAGGALPGVAIAVALVPPLATAGTLIGRGETDLAVGAMLLLATNLAGIVLAASLVFLATGFVPSARSIGYSREIRVGLAVSALIVIAVAYPLWAQGTALLRDTQADGIVQTAAEAFIEQSGADSVVLSVDVNQSVSPTQVIVAIGGTGDVPSQAEVNKAAADLAGDLGEPISLSLRFTPMVVSDGAQTIESSSR